MPSAMRSVKMRNKRNVLMKFLKKYKTYYNEPDCESGKLYVYLNILESGKINAFEVTY